MKIYQVYKDGEFLNGGAWAYFSDVGKAFVKNPVKRLKTLFTKYDKMSVLKESYLITIEFDPETLESSVTKTPMSEVLQIKQQLK